MTPLDSVLPATNIAAELVGFRRQVPGPRWCSLLWLAACLALVACESSDPGVDGGKDAGTDAGKDAGTDAGKDAGTDAGKDAGTDAGNDAGTDAGSIGKATWTIRTESLGAKNWQAIASSADGTKLAAVAYGGHIYTSSNSGVTWTDRSTGSNGVVARWYKARCQSKGHVYT